MTRNSSEMMQNVVVINHRLWMGCDSGAIINLVNVFDEHTIENTVSAQKRAEVKLDSPRSTAKRTVRRPAEASARLSGDFLRTLLLTGLIAAATLVLLAARLTDRPTSLPALSSAIAGWFGSSEPVDSETVVATQAGPNSAANIVVVDANATVSTEGGSETSEVVGDDVAAIAESSAEVDSIEQQGSESDEAAPAYSLEGQPLELLLESDFRDASFPLARDDQEESRKWKMTLSPGQGIYQIAVFPGYLAWSTLGFELAQPFRVETGVIIADGLLREAAESMELDGTSGYAGLIARYQDPSNFYLFNIDGQGRSQLLSQVDGVWTTISPWTPTVLVKPTPEENELAVEDDGRFLRFFVNGAPIHEVEPLLTDGLVGLASGTGIQYASLSNFDWIRIYGTK